MERDGVILYKYRTKSIIRRIMDIWQFKRINIIQSGSACPFVSEPNAPAVHANLPYPQSLRFNDELHLHIAKLQWCKTAHVFLSTHQIILNLKISYGFHIFFFYFLPSFLSFQKKKTKKISVIKIDELISCINLRMGRSRG